jgi:hypothetical protein
LALWTNGLVADEALQGINWEWLAREGAMTTAPLGGNQVGKHPTDRGQTGIKRSVLTVGGGVPLGRAVEGAKRNDCKMGRPTLCSIPLARPTPTAAQPQGIGLD